MCGPRIESDARKPLSGNDHKGVGLQNNPNPLKLHILITEPGEKRNITLEAESEPFTSWSTHAEPGSGDHSHDDGHDHSHDDGHDHSHEGDSHEHN
jgi:ABC-type Zn2+ transport system substrate-binding protein/surface adhesin